MVGICVMHARNSGRATRVGRRRATEWERGHGAVRELLYCVGGSGSGRGTEEEEEKEESRGDESEEGRRSAKAARPPCGRLW